MVKRKKDNVIKKKKKTKTTKNKKGVCMATVVLSNFINDKFIDRIYQNFNKKEKEN